MLNRVVDASPGFGRLRRHEAVLPTGRRAIGHAFIDIDSVAPEAAHLPGSRLDDRRGIEATTLWTVGAIFVGVCARLSTRGNRTAPANAPQAAVTRLRRCAAKRPNWEMPCCVAGSWFHPSTRFPPGVLQRRSENSTRNGWPAQW
jgi:hypothetical protein